MSNRKLTQEIYKEDCVGDSSGKHNYNLMSLDTYICNLSSEFFISKNNFYTIFSDFIKNYPIFIQATNLFLDPSRYNLVTATVNLLSAYWDKHEFSVHYPLNISLLNNLAISCPTVNQLDQKLISLAKTYLNKNYPATGYTKNTNVNVIFFLYNVPVNPNDPNDLITFNTSPEFSFMTRHMYAEYIKQDIHLGNGKIFKFYNDNNGNWIYDSLDVGSTEVTKQPIFVKGIPPRISTRPSTENGRSTIELTLVNDTTNFDLFYQTVHSGLYYAGYTDVILTINRGVNVGSNVNGGAALVVSGFTVGDTITIKNNGNIYGYGGLGGDGESLGIPLSNSNNGSNGGDAILLTFPTKIVNNGVIAGGGGGGAGGIATYNNTSYITLKGKKGEKLQGGGGGGGGAGYAGGAAGSGGFKNVKPLNPKIKYLWTDSAGTDGISGTFNTPGNGGSGYVNGGTGGTLGSDGINTGVKDAKGTQLPPLGGKAGAAIKGYNFINSITTTNSNPVSINGDIRGLFVL